MHAIIDAEAALFARKKELQPRHINEQGESEVASLSMLATNQATNPVEERRRSSFEGFREIERWVLDNGFLDLVKLRNRFARALGFDNYFELKLRKNERMTPAQLTRILDDFVARTDAANARSLAELQAAHGEQALAPWNLRFFASGDVVRRMDEYMPFGLALRRWVESFRRLGIQFRGATMQLDLMERPGKYQNGFCHGPIPTWVNEQGEWVPGQINFTAEAKPDQVGSGLRAINTLFHEGGHAAHFANVAQNAPCFSQEYAPTSMAYAETQSMFCDSLLGDADWLKRYARNAQGEAIPDALIRDRVASSQPMRAFDERSIAVVPYFEAALYQLPDAALTPEAVLALARDDRAARARHREPAADAGHPAPAQPGIGGVLSGLSAGPHGGVPDARVLPAPRRLPDRQRRASARRWPSTTGRPATASTTRPRCAASPARASRRATWPTSATSRSRRPGPRRARRRWRPRRARQYPGEAAASLDAHIRVVHGAEVLADSSDGEDAMCDRFEAWVREHYPAAPR